MWLLRVLHFIYYVLFPFSALSGILYAIGFAGAGVEVIVGCAQVDDQSWLCTAIDWLQARLTWFLFAFVGTAGILLFSVLLSKILRYRRMRTAIKTSFYAAKAIEGLHNAHREVAKLLDRVPRISQKALYDCSSLCYTETREVLDEIARFYTFYTGRQCHASLKMFEYRPDQPSQLLETYCRDGEQHPDQRERIDNELEQYHYQRNTAFEKILDDPKVRFYVNNHLLWSRRWGRYKNANSHWDKYYNATLVIPLVDEYYPDKIKLPEVIGFLCVDNKGGGFDKEIAAFSGRFFARTLYPVMIEFRELEFLEG